MRRSLALLTLAVLGAGCLGPMDDPTTVQDLRVLAVQLEPPEIMVGECPPFTAENFEDALVAHVQAHLATYAAQVHLTPLVVDPREPLRSVRYDLYACADTADRTCEEDRVELATGEATLDGVGQGFDLQPGLALTEEGTPLLLRVYQEDQNLGLGGLRMPLVLRVRAADEEIYAQKLMVFSCPIFPGMAANVNPALPSLLLQGAEWADGATPPVTGEGPFEIEVPPLLDPVSGAALEEDYVVPSFSGTPIPLTESWRIAWHADYGTLSPAQSGGTDLGGQTRRLRSRWSPPDSGATARTVRFWAVARDGRGGISWLVRDLAYSP